MAVTADTTQKLYYDGNMEGLPLGVRDYDTTGKVMPVISNQAPPTVVAGAMYFNPTTGKLWMATDPTTWVGKVLT